MKKSLSSNSLNSINISSFNSSLGISPFNSSLGIRKSISNNSLLSLDYELSSDKIHNEIEYIVTQTPITKIATCNLSKYMLNLPNSPSIKADEIETIGACLAEPSEIMENIDIINMVNLKNIRYYWLERSLDEKELGIRYSNLYAKVRRKKFKI